MNPRDSSIGSSLVDHYASLWERDGEPDVFDFLQQHDDHPVSEKLAVLLFDQSHRWKTDMPILVEHYLKRVPAVASDEQSRIELIVGEFNARQSSGKTVSVDDCISRFSDLEETLKSRLKSMAESPAGPDDPNPTVSHQSSSSGLARLGRYRLVRLLGEGGFGRVWLAEDEELKRPVAVKVPTPERFAAPEDADKYLSEARTVASLDHPNILPVHDVGRAEDGWIFVVSKFVEGCDLARRIADDRPGFKESAKLIAASAQALYHAHQKNIIHRDVKPGNILIDQKSGQPFVADFGLAIKEEDYLQKSGVAGTPEYMSPEQARGEGHRLDGRSDIFSLGVVLYELLTGKRLFGGATTYEILHEVISAEPKPPKELNDQVPGELERICLKALAKRASDRYATANEFADDLLHWLSGPPEVSVKQATIVPKGLRSFDAEDTDFFLDLLPGPRDRNGLPDSIRFWKTRIEEIDPDKTFPVGLLYGPSGCGKSSLVKAGLLPRLSKEVKAIYVEATPDDTESRILRGLRKHLPKLSDDLDLVEAFASLRRGSGPKTIVVLDQFEQWLHAHPPDQGTKLVAALRQCDGGRLQSVCMVRDDFWLSSSRFMRELDVRIVEGHNSALVDLFDQDHARHVLAKFGQAFGRIPAQLSGLTQDHSEFLGKVAAGLAQDGKVVPVRISLFAEMVKGKSWTLSTLNELGGTEGVGLTFLEETFSARSAPPEHQLHQQAARNVLQALLPEAGADIKGHMRSHAELLKASGYSGKERDFNDLLRILDGELRLITPTDPEGAEVDSGNQEGSKYYQLTHDYLVSSLREWLTRKQQETRKGRAELKLAERAALWNAKRENRHLPSLLEWASIRMLTEKKKWTKPQRRIMRRAGRFHGLRSTAAIGFIVAATLAGLHVRRRVNEASNQERASGLVTALVNANIDQVPGIIDDLSDYRKWADPKLAAEIQQHSENSNERLQASLALLATDPTQLSYLKRRLLNADAEQVETIRTILGGYKDKLVADLWHAAEQGDGKSLLQAASALSVYDPDNDERWNGVAAGVVDALVKENALQAAVWIKTLRPARRHLLDSLSAVYRNEDLDRSDTQIDLATDVLEQYAADDVTRLGQLLLDANAAQFVDLFDEFAAHAEEAEQFLNEELANMRVLWQRPIDADSGREVLARRQANAAVAALRMGRHNRVWPLLRYSPDPRVRSYIIHWLSPRGGDPRTVWSRYEQESDLTVKRALLLCLGEFDLPQGEMQTMIDSLLDVYRSDPDAGLHAAVEWLLRRWGRKEAIEEQIEQWSRDKTKGEEWWVEGNDAPPATRHAPPVWYVNNQGQTYVILDAGVFVMGSPDSEAGRRSNERRRRRRIDRRIAISTKEVTRKEWRAFANDVKVWPADQQRLAPYVRTDDAPMIAMTWYEAAWYCNWLSEQEGIPGDQWCYEKNAQGEYGAGMKAKANFLELTGYRLPTDAEWEFACRAGTRTSRYYGATESLLPHYAWYEANGERHAHPVASKKPNDFGLFDMQGNVYEWCFDAYASNDAAVDSPSVEPVVDSDLRVLRGGAFDRQPEGVRSANRNNGRSVNRSNVYGFRPARTFRSSSKR